MTPKYLSARRLPAAVVSITSQIVLKGISLVVLNFYLLDQHELRLGVKPPNHRRATSVTTISPEAQYHSRKGIPMTLTLEPLRPIHESEHANSRQLDLNGSRPVTGGKDFPNQVPQAPQKQQSGTKEHPPDFLIQAVNSYLPAMPLDTSLILVKTPKQQL